MCDFHEYCGNFIASVVPKCYICSLQFEHGEGEESVTTRRFIVMADYIDKLKCVKLNLLIVKYMTSSAISTVYSRIKISCMDFQPQ